MTFRVHVFSTLLLLSGAIAGLGACAAPTPAPINLNVPSPTTVVAAPTVSAPTGVPAASAAPSDTPNVPAGSTEAPAAVTTAPTDVAAATQSVPPTTAPASAAPEDYFGANTTGEIVNNQQVRALATLAGVQMVRVGIAWNGIENTKGTYKWDYPDSMFKTLTGNNFVPLVLILGNPAWAASSECGPVNDLLGLEEFIHTLAARYPQVHYWALGNEPDNAGSTAHPETVCFGGNDVNGNGKPDVEDYAEELHIAWRAIHAANPNAELVTGALAFDNFNEATAPPGYPGGGNGGSFDYNFPQQLFADMQQHPLAQGEKYFDVLSFNFYFIYGPYWEQQAGGISINAKANMLNRLMSNAGLSAPLLVSETGDDSTRIGDTGQSAYLVETFTRGLASGITHMVWWTYQDYPDSAPPPQNTWKYGLIDQNQSPKPAYAAYQTISHELTGAIFQQAMQVNGGEGYLFTKDNGGKAVVWSSSDSPITLAFAASQLTVTDMYGSQKIIADGSADDTDSTAGRIGIAIGKNPLYVRVSGR